MRTKTGGTNGSRRRGRRPNEAVFALILIPEVLAHGHEEFGRFGQQWTRLFRARTATRGLAGALPPQRVPRFNRSVFSRRAPTYWALSATPKRDFPLPLGPTRKLIAPTDCAANLLPCQGSGNTKSIGRSNTAVPSLSFALTCARPVYSHTASHTTSDERDQAAFGIGKFGGRARAISSWDVRHWRIRRGI